MGSMKTSVWFDEMVLQNNWIGVHALGGAALAVGGELLKWQKMSIVFFIFFLSVCWEAVEWMGKNMAVAYGSWRRAILDSVGDVLFATIAAFLVVVA